MHYLQTPFAICYIRHVSPLGQIHSVYPEVRFVQRLWDILSHVLQSLHEISEEYPGGR